ncbi:hypothetical protein ES705_43968 [subsurface metagenome]
MQFTRQQLQEMMDKRIKSQVDSMVDEALEPYTTITPAMRVKALGLEEEISSGELKFVDDKGVEHRIYRSNEKMASPLTEGLSEYSFGRIVRANIIGNNSDLSYEEKALSGGVGSAGGFLISEQVVAGVVDKARNLACCFKAGAKTFTMGAPEVRICKVKTDPQAYYRAENTEITEGNWEIEDINLKALTMGVLITISLELIQDAPNAAQAIQDSMSAAIAQKLDLGILSGDGVNNILGIANYPDVNIIDKGENGATITDYDDFSNAVEDVYDHNGIPNAVIFSPRTLFTIDRLKQATVNEPLSGPASYQALQKYATNQVATDDTHGSSSAASKAYIGDFTQVLVGLRSGLQIETSRSAGDSFKKVQLQIRALMRLDSVLVRPGFFTVIEGIIV